MRTINKRAFTIIELMVSVIIIGILTTIWFYSYTKHISGSRDVERKANMWEIITALKLYKQNRGSYPIPGSYFNITNNWAVVAMQWKLNKDVMLTTMDKLPTDPSTWSYYTYSTTISKQETQVAISLENNEFPVSFLEWDYKTVSKNVLPSIVLAIDSTLDVEIHNWVWTWTDNRNKFLFDWLDSLPYSLSTPHEPYHNWQTLETNLADTKINFWQNSDYRTCYEISEAWKYIHTTWSEEYQILNESWVLTDTWCAIQ